MDLKKILLTGGTGFIGNYLAGELMKAGHYLTVITRSPGKYSEEEATNQRFVSWSADLAAIMDETDVVVNLAGENLFDKRWTKQVKKQIYESRVDSTRKLTEAMREANQPPDLFISASAVGIYGDSGDRVLDESEAAGSDFLARVCVGWESEATKASELGVRVAIPRIGIVLEKNGGVLEKMRMPFLFFVGGAIGTGRQYVPWIHMRDICCAVLYPLKNKKISGPYNACSPNPATMDDLAAAIGEAMNRPSFFRVPEFMVSAALGEAAEPVLGSLRAEPKVLQQHGFRFDFEDLQEAVNDVL